MTRGMISEMFTVEQAERHAALIERHLRFPDGVRLMDRPMEYRGGPSRIFKRAESAANFGREVGLQYVHAHIRYVEAMAKMGRPDDVTGSIERDEPVHLPREPHPAHLCTLDSSSLQHFAHCCKTPPAGDPDWSRLHAY